MVNTETVNSEIKIGMNKLYYSSYFFLIVSLYALYNKLYISSILIFYLFITSIVYWNDYNNKFKLYGDQYIVFVLIFYTIYYCFKIKNYLCLVSIIMLLLLYYISYYYNNKGNSLVSSNLWILTHSMISMSMVYLINKMKIYNEKNKK
jgi:hypothetical protein